MATKEARAERLEAMLMYLSSPRSLHEIAEEFNCSYHTARRDVDELIERKLASVQGRLGGDGRSLFQAKPDYGLPEFTIKATKQEVNLVDFAKGYVDSNFAPPASVKLIHEFMGLSVTILELARALNEGEITPTQAEENMATIRRQLIRTHQIVDSLADLINQFLNAAALWNVDRLGDLPADVKFPSIYIRPWYEQMLRHFNTTPTGIEDPS